MSAMSKTQPKAYWKVCNSILILHYRAICICLLKQICWCSVENQLPALTRLGILNAQLITHAYVGKQGFWRFADN